MKNNKKKGFTLVELLVVIAILAILATVSILGYTSFTGKAKASNSEQELSQMKTMLLADWLDGFVGEAKDQIAITKKTSESDPKGWYEVVVAADKMATFEGTLKAAFGTDVDSTMAGKVTFVGSKTENKESEVVVSYTCKITSVVYVAPNGYTATWTINGDTIKADKDVEAPTSVFKIN